MHSLKYTQLSAWLLGDTSHGHLGSVGFYWNQIVGDDED